MAVSKVMNYLGHYTCGSNGQKVCRTGWTNSDCLSCATNYYGSDCGTYCYPRDDYFGHYTCGSNGEKYALLDGPMLTVCLVLPTIMVITVGLIVSHTMIPLAITHAAVMERKCAIQDGLEPITPVVG